MDNMSPMDPDVLLIWEKQLKEREKELKKKESQMGIFLHDLRNCSNALCITITRRLHFNNDDPDFEKKAKVYDSEIAFLLRKIKYNFDANQLFFVPSLLERDFVRPTDVKSIITSVSSLYSKRAIHITEELTKEHKPYLGSYFELAVAMVIDSAFYNAPYNTDFNISFLEYNECLTVEFKCWEICIDRKNDYYSMKHEFGAGIIWNGTDKDIALTLFKQICDSYNINYAFSKGDEEKVINEKKCQSCIVKLIFNNND